MRNEAPYLPEWIQWHRHAGVSRFFLYDNESGDDTVRVAEAQGEDVEVLDWSQQPAKGHSPQMLAYEHCLSAQAHAHEVEWLVIVDVDEFVWHPDGRAIPEVLHGVQQDHVWMPWLMFGWGSHLMRQRSTLQAYRWRAPDTGPGFPTAGKSAVRVGGECLVADPHWFGGLAKAGYPGLRVNHYFTRSKMEAYQRRIVQQRAWVKTGMTEWAEIVRRGDEASTIYDDRLAVLAEKGDA